MTSQAIEEVEDIHLFIKQNAEGQVDATTPISWNVSQEIVQELEKKGAWNPCLLIGIANDGVEVGRYVVPLKNGMQYVQFTRPGKNVVYSTIIWTSSSYKEDQPAPALLGSTWQIFDTHYPESDKVAAQIDAFYDRHGRDSEVLSDETREEVEALFEQRRKIQQKEQEVVKGLGGDYPNSLRRTEAHAEIAVNVPGEMFAQEPPRWMKWLGNLWDWHTQPRDQCQLRRRALMTGAALPFVGLVIALAFIVMEVVLLTGTGVMLLFGMRDIDFSPIRHPFSGSPQRIWSGVSPSVFLYRRMERDGSWHGYRYEARAVPFLLIYPPFMLFCIIAGAVTWYFDVFGTILIGAAIAAAVGVVFVAVVSCINWIGPKISVAFDDKKEQRKLKKEELEKSNPLSTQLAPFTALNGTTQPVKRLRDLPKEQRTVALRYQGLKAAVCKPFAK